jgi:hypothetical protein
MKNKKKKQPPLPPPDRIIKEGEYPIPPKIYESNFRI